MSKRLSKMVRIVAEVADVKHGADRVVVAKAAERELRIWADNLAASREEAREAGIDTAELTLSVWLSGAGSRSIIQFQPTHQDAASPAGKHRLCMFYADDIIAAVEEA